MRRRIAVLAAIVLLAAYLMATPLLRAAGRYLVLDEPLEKADAIVVLSGSFPDRILEAVDLYAAGMAPQIVLCREPENGGFRQLRERGVVLPRGYELNQAVAEQLAVPSEAILVVDRADRSTFSEARRVIDFVLRRGFTKVLLVTSKFHTRRAGAIYRHLAGDRLRIIMRPTRYDSFAADEWWRDRLWIRRVVIEYQKLLLFQLFDRWRVAPRGEAAITPPAPPESRPEL
jgi:uncharacterized SAM-binding protein YcdF (DUF218 family)